ncbi:MAG: PD-(D/E)XK nuclease-like domain-containing protein [Acidobacteriales bacterium]|nr:PD-(D/E)XK nuclease-like domain-containing protein [Terriglobales bacterium]
MTTFPTLPFIREPAENYRSRRAEFLTSHQLADFAACPLLYRMRQSGLLPERYSEAYAIGSAAHCLILEGQEVFDAQYVVGGPINPKTERPYGQDTKKFAEWATAQQRIGLSDEQYLLVSQLAASVRRHAIAAELLTDGLPEAVLRSEYCGVQCQTRYDWFNPRRGLVDLKTCDDLDNFAESQYVNSAGCPDCTDALAGDCTDALAGDAAKYGYVPQMAFYRAVYRAVTGLTVPVHLIAVEKRQPQRCGVWLIHADELSAAEVDNEFFIEQLRECRAADTWPSGYEGLRTLGGC